MSALLAAVKKSKSHVDIPPDVALKLSYAALGKHSLRTVQKSSLKQLPHLSENEVIEESPSIKFSNPDIVTKTPLEVELEIQTNRIIYILEKTIRRLELAACLPIFIQNNGEILRLYLEPVEVDFILDVCSGYTDIKLRPFTDDQISNITYMGKIIDEISLNRSRSKSDKVSLGKKISVVAEKNDVKVDPHMSQALELMMACRSLRDRIEDYLPKATQVSHTFINCVLSLKEIALLKLSVTAIEEREREKELRKAWKENLEAKQNINNLQEQLDKQREELGAQLTIKHEIMERYRKKIEDLSAKFKEDTRNRIQESEKGMVEDTRASEIRQAELSIEAKQAQQQYQTLLEQHLAYEKGLRAKRFKVETQLASWLAKYDADMGERQAEFEEITKGYEEEKAEMDSLQEKFDEQEEEYEILMAEKEEEEMILKEELAQEYLRHRSARLIQRCWRAYRERKLARRKARKGKGKDKKKGSGGGKGKGKKNKKQDSPEPVQIATTDPNAALASAFKGGLLEEMDTTKQFSKTAVVVDLAAGPPLGVTEVKTAEKAED